MSKREYVLENWLREKVKAMGGLALKMEQFRGIPDRIVLLPDRPPIWLELKAEDGKPSPIQEAVIRKLRGKGFEVHVCSTKEEILKILNL